MARLYSKLEALDLQTKHTRLLNSLKEINSAPDLFRNEVIDAADMMKKKEVYSILSEISVDELNRDKAGIRVKILKENGFETIADVLKPGVSGFDRFDGIGFWGASDIDRVADDIREEVSDGVRIKLNSDSKSEESTNLVKALYKMRMSASLENQSNDILSKYEQLIEIYLEDLQPLFSGVGWYFKSKKRRKTAEDSYKRLLDLSCGEYSESVSRLSDLYEKTKNIDDILSWEDFQNNTISYNTLLESICPDLIGNADEMYGLPKQLATEIQDESIIQAGLKCELRRYQEWGVRFILHQKRVLLGDEMGLGKTVQAIASMVTLWNLGMKQFIVVCPASVLENWCREIEKHSNLSVIKVHGKEREDAFALWLSQGGVAVTTYETTKIFDFSVDFRFDMLVVDEAHYVKNPEAMRSRYIQSMSNRSERVLFMTGTALENRVDEMVELIRILRPDIAKTVKRMRYLSSAPRFREVVSPVYYRRKRDQVLAELPDLIENKEWCVMSSKEEKEYEKALYSGNFMQIRRVSWNVEDKKDSSKAKRLLEIVADAKDDGRKVIVFSFFLDTIQAVRKLLGGMCTSQIDGSVPPKKRQEIIDAFDKAPVGTVLPAQITSGGTGLNIQSASVVVICEPQYKPSTENQAISRAYRMGQSRNVLVHRLLCVNSIEERILGYLERKQIEFDAFADKSIAAEEDFGLNDQTFGEMIREEIERISSKHMTIV